MPYIELRAHTAFSFGDGSATPEALVQRAHALGYRKLAITDTADQTWFEYANAPG